MASLFSVPPRPTSNSHDLKALRELSEWLKSERKTLNILCDGMGCSKRVAKVCARVSPIFLTLWRAQVKKHYDSAKQRRIALSR